LNKPTYSTTKCSACGREHIGIQPIEARDGAYILCPTDEVRIYAFKESWKKDSTIKKIWQNLDPRAAITAFGIVGFLTLGMAGCPKYAVWTSEMHGRAELARATSNRMIAVQEAEAKLEAAYKLADAEIARAHGVAKANEIIGTSLKGNEAYLRYLWIESLHTNPNSQVIYVPTEANLPILEANRGVKK